MKAFNSQTTKQLNNNSRSTERGFTLIEILIAAAIFVSVITIAAGIFTANSNVQTTTETLRTSSQAGRYLMEAIARDVRTAQNGFEICNSLDCSITAMPMADGEQGGNFLKVHKSASETTIYGWQDSTFKVWTDATAEPVVVIPDNFIAETNDTNLIFQGISSGTSANRAFVTIQFNIQTKDTARASEQASQTMRTTITSR